MKRKIIQIIYLQATETTVPSIIALCNDGSVWESEGEVVEDRDNYKWSNWEEFDLPNIPQPLFN